MMQTSPLMLDAAARRRVLLEHHRTLLVEAGAGSGKTALLAGRVALMLAAGVLPAAIVAITFTEAAASELRERVAMYVSRLRAGEIPKEIAAGIGDALSAEQHGALARAELALDELTCSTIHSFCQRLIAPYCVEACIDPGATVLEGNACALLRSEVVVEWLTEKLNRLRSDGASEDESDDILTALIEVAGIDVLSEMMQWAEYFCAHRSLAGREADATIPSVTELCDAIDRFASWYGACGLREVSTEAQIQSLLKLRKALAPYSGDALTARELVTALTLERPATCKKNDAQFLRYRVKGKWGDAAKSAGSTKSFGEQLNDEATKLYGRCADAYPVWLAEVVDASCAKVVAAFSSISTTYALRKERSAALDFDDLLLFARDLVRDHAHVRTALAERYRHILVDEFQDTDPLQAELLWHLCAESTNTDTPWHEFDLREGSLFVVADPKQAIYRFRGADIATYLCAKQSLCARHDDALVNVNANFRSDARILDYVNTTFMPLLSTDDQPGFTALFSASQVQAERTALHAIHVALDDVPRDRSGNPTVDGLRTAEARAVAESVASVLADGTVIDRDEKSLRPCRPGDIALLAATGSALWIYERELDMLGIPLASQAGKGFFGRQEVHDLIALVRALADPRDTLAFGAFIRGPLIGLSEAEIADGVMEARSQGRSLDLFTDPSCLSHPLLQATLTTLQVFLRKSLRTTPYQLLSETVEAFHMCAVLRAREPRSCERSLQNVEKFLTLSRSYDARGLMHFAISLREQWLAQESVEEGRSDRVENALVISTMHSSKGLEWPIVIPINSVTRIDGKPGRFFLERETNAVHFKILGMCGSAYEQHSENEKLAHRAEAVRLWYVALTRARDLLMVPHIAERSSSDWMSAINLSTADLPVFDGLARRYRAIEEELVEPQDAALWQLETQRLVSMQKIVDVHYPSRHDREALETFDDNQMLLAEFTGEEEAKIQGSRERGLCLHKLLEEVINKELDTMPAHIQDRASVLVAQIGSDAQESISPNELADCVIRTLAIPQIADLLPRLSAEVPVYAATESADSLEVVAGIMDAVAWAVDGTCDIVIDWKSDVDPNRAPLAEYKHQIRTYLTATGAKSGLLVFLSTGTIIAVEQSQETINAVLTEDRASGNHA